MTHAAKIIAALAAAVAAVPHAPAAPTATPVPSGPAASEGFGLEPPGRNVVWMENAGWINTGIACSGTSARVIRDQGNPSYAGHIAGYLWHERLGWINFGQNYSAGSPYAPDTLGVNISPSGRLTGFAWSEGSGWINFDPSGLVPVLRPELAGSRLFGFAWAENTGWVNMDLEMPEPGLFCAADIDRSGNLNFDDIDAFIAAFMENSPCADTDANGRFNLDDVQGFVTIFLEGCL